MELESNKYNESLKIISYNTTEFNMDDDLDESKINNSADNNEDNSDSDDDFDLDDDIIDKIKNNIDDEKKLRKIKELGK